MHRVSWSLQWPVRRECARSTTDDSSYRDQPTAALRPPHAAVLIDRRRALRNIARMQALAAASGIAAPAARQDAQVAGRRAVADRARRRRHLLREARRGRGVRRRRHRRHPPALSGQPVERRAAARADGSRGDLDHRRSPGGRARLVGRDAAAPAARSTCWSRSTSAFIAAASIRPRDAARVRQDGGGAAGTAAPRPAEPRRPRLSRRVGGRAASASRATKPRPCSRDLATRAARSGIAIDEISVGATPTLRFSAGSTGVTELRPGNYVYFDRTQVALGAATLDDCALTVLATVVSKPAGTHHPRLRQQDADQRSGARASPRRPGSARC